MDATVTVTFKALTLGKSIAKQLNVKYSITRQDASVASVIGYLSSSQSKAIGLRETKTYLVKSGSDEPFWLYQDGMWLAREEETRLPHLFIA